MIQYGTWSSVLCESTACIDWDKSEGHVWETICHILLYDTLPESEGSGLSSNVVGDAKGQGILSCGAFPSPLHRSLSNVIGTIN